MAPSGTKTFGAEFPGPGTRVTGLFEWFASRLPSGVKVILNFAPEGDAAVNGCPVKKVAFMSFGTIGSAAKVALAPKSIDIAITSRLTRSTQKSPCPARSLRGYLARNLLQAFAVLAGS